MMVRRSYWASVCGQAVAAAALAATVGVLALPQAALAAPPPIKYKTVQFNLPGAIIYDSLGISSSGVVYGDATTGPGVGEGFTYKNGVFSTVPGPTGSNATVDHIASNGDIAGQYDPVSFNYQRAYDLSHGVYSTIGLPPASGDQMFTVVNNDHGYLAGNVAPTPFTAQGFTYENGVYTTISVPGASHTSITQFNDNNVVAGNYGLGASVQNFGYMYAGGTYTTIAPRP